MSKFTPTHKSIVLLEVWHCGEKKDLTDLVAIRAEMLDKVELTEARLLCTVELETGEVK